MQSLREASQALRKGFLDPVQLCENCLQIAAKTKKCNAFVKITASEARKEACCSLQRYKRKIFLGPLDGIPIAIKDNFNIKGLTTTCASNMLRNYESPYTATVVKRLLSSGSVLVGKTNMDEFAMGTGSVDSIFGPVRNPWSYHSNDERDSNDSDDFAVCGGSSGGSAVAVALGACFAALGSDTGGSTRSPAALCGVVGLKPTYGLLSRHGLVPLVNSMDVPGIFTKTVDDAALILVKYSDFCLLAGQDVRDSTTVPDKFIPFNLPDRIDLKGLRIGIPQEFYCERMNSDVIDAWHAAANVLELGGARLVSVSLPHTRHSIACYSVLNSCEVASNFARYDGVEFGFRASKKESTEALYAESRHSGFNDVVRERILAGNYFLLKRQYEKYFKTALKVRRLISEDYAKVFDGSVDVLLTPTTLSDAQSFKDFSLKHNREQVALQDFCTQPVNMAGIPAVSIPIQLSRNNLPIGLQLISNYFQEKLILTVGKYLEREVCFPKLNYKN
uniref:Glutamyl-tRNA(Gln) amidotransferase subunit A, mitochondrial n=1 Tax=Strigamia maritima TaxID=126957 RepID=T1IY23_STRMM